MTSSYKGMAIRAKGMFFPYLPFMVGVYRKIKATNLTGSNRLGLIQISTNPSKGSQ